MRDEAFVQILKVVRYWSGRFSLTDLARSFFFPFFFLNVNSTSIAKLCQPNYIFNHNSESVKRVSV